MPRIVFVGLRKEFLEQQLDNYHKATTEGTRDDFVNDVCRRFLKRFPLDLPLDKEPTQAYLATVDDSKPDPEIEHPVPDPGNGGQRKDNEACERYMEQINLLQTRKAVSDRGILSSSSQLSRSAMRCSRRRHRCM